MPRTAILARDTGLRLFALLERAAGGLGLKSMKEATSRLDGCGLRSPLKENSCGQVRRRRRTNVPCSARQTHALLMREVRWCEKPREVSQEEISIHSHDL